MKPAILLVVALVFAGCVLGPSEREVSYYGSLVGGSPFTDLIVEIDHAPRHKPSDLAREHLLGELRNVTGKVRVVVRVEESLRAEPGRTWNVDQLLALEAATRSAEHKAPVAVLHVLYPAGEYERPGVAGITISGRGLGPITVFLDTISEINVGLTPIPQPSQGRDQIERSTLLHEAGHAMGLVNNGIPMVRDHEDKGSPGHSTSRQSVMYKSVDSTSGIREALLQEGRIPFYFDDADRADLRNIGGR